VVTCVREWGRVSRLEVNCGRGGVQRVLGDKQARSVGILQSHPGSGTATGWRRRPSMSVEKGRYVAMDPRTGSHPGDGQSRNLIQTLGLRGSDTAEWNETATGPKRPC